MNHDEMMAMPLADLLARTQTNVTPDAAEGLAFAIVAYGRTEVPIEKGTAARQAGFRAEQAGEAPETVQEWFNTSRSALSSNDPHIRRELIATELLAGRALALRIERMGSNVVELVTRATEAFGQGEAILQEQHLRGKPWDRFGTMLARHRATHEAMNGTTVAATVTAARGLWRALRAQKEGTPEAHTAFVVKQLGMNAAAGALALSKPLQRSSKVAGKRHQLALKLLG